MQARCRVPQEGKGAQAAHLCFEQSRSRPDMGNCECCVLSCFQSFLSFPRRKTTLHTPVKALTSSFRTKLTCLGLLREWKNKPFSANPVVSHLVVSWLALKWSLVESEKRFVSRIKTDKPEPPLWRFRVRDELRSLRVVRIPQS